MTKLISIDLDGTLLQSDGTISKENLAALHYAHQRGVKIVLCTGRPYFSMQSFVTEIGLTSSDDYIITFNGGQVQKASDGTIIEQFTLSGHDMHKWYALTEQLNVPLNLIDGQYVYEPLNYPANHRSLYFDERKNLVTKKVDYHEISPTHSFNKMVICCEQSWLDAQIKNIPTEYFNDYSLFKSRNNLFEIIAKGVTKGNTLSALAQKLAILPSEIMAIGDQENDLSMIELAGIGVAMGNAVDSVKAVANYITSSNDQNGVAQAIYHYIK